MTIQEKWSATTATATASALWEDVLAREDGMVSIALRGTVKIH